MSFREWLLRTFVLVGTAVFLITELLSALGSLHAKGLVSAWAITLLGALTAGWLHAPRLQTRRPGVLDAAYFTSITAIAAVIGYTAWLSPPNSADAMAYHVPRVVYWAQQQSVAFFATPYLNQIMLQPGAEYWMLHTYVLSSGDHFVNLVQWTGLLGSLIAVSLIAQALGLSGRGQILTALFCATLPNGVLQASGAKNDYLLALWLAAMVYFTLQWTAKREAASLLFAALALGLALGTKGTAYLFAPFFMVGALAASGVRLTRREVLTAAGAACAGTLLINTPQFVRNYDLSGSILGFDSAHGDGVFRWRNDSLGWRPLVSNAIRNASEQLGDRSEAWNQSIYRAALSLHSSLGLNPQDVRTTWPGTEFKAPKNANHEADANNRWHLLLLAIALAYAAARDRRWVWYAAGPIAAWLAFCLYLKWQPFLARLELPLFVIASPLAGLFLASLRPTVIQIVVAMNLLGIARLPLTENWTRPLSGLSRQPREEAYFNDMAQWNNRGSYLAAVERAVQSGCRVVGIDANENQLEYPLQALLRARIKDVRFVHVNVRNASRKYETSVQPCITLTPGQG